jgi:uncharacterized protein (TIGR00369 family)
MRDLRLWIERDAGGSRAGFDLVPEVLNDRGHVRAGVLATLADAAGGDCAVREARPESVATSDLVLHVTRPLRSGTVVATPRVLRKTRATLVLEVELTGNGVGVVETQKLSRGNRAAGELAGLVTMTFAVLPARSEVQRMGSGRAEPRTELALEGSRLDAPLLERIGARVVDAAAGAIELPLTPYVGNSLGGLQGGVVAALADASAEVCARAASAEPCVTTDLALNYLALGRGGPIRTNARVLRAEPAGALVRVELRDAGRDDRLMAVATVTAERFG